MVVGANLPIGKIVPYHVEVDSIVELECAITLLRNLVVWTARMMDQVILKLKTAIHRSVQVGLINPHKPITPRQLVRMRCYECTCI